MPPPPRDAAAPAPEGAWEWPPAPPTSTPGLRATSLAHFLSLVSTTRFPVAYRLAAHEQSRAHAEWAAPTTGTRLASCDVPVRVHRGTRRGEGAEYTFFDVARQGPLELAEAAVVHETTLGDVVGRLRDEAESGRVARRVEMLSGTDTHLVLESGVVSKWADVWRDVEGMVTSHVPRGSMQRVGFWVSGAALASQMHFDVNGHHNLNYQITGAKSVVMFAPSDWPNLYPMPARLWHLSRVDPRPGHLSLDSHPLVKRTQPIVFHLEPGDVLYIPSLWVHHFTHVGRFNVNVTAWFTSPDSGVKWTWASLLVAKPLEAWFFVGKIVAALVGVLPFKLGWKFLWGGAEGSDGRSAKGLYA